jgi:hypothetical protein
MFKMLNSIEQLTLKTGQEVIIMSHRDIIDTIRDTLGDPLANLVAAELVNTPNIYYDKEACKPDVEPKVGGIYRVTHDVYFGDEVCLWKGDIVKIISDFRKVSYEVQSLMPTKNDNGKWWLTTGCLEEV